jgi:hypothetical protein
MTGRIASCPYGGVQSYVWQINMHTATVPLIITITPMSHSCFNANPVLDPQGTGIAWFSNRDSYNVRPCSVT